VLWSLWSRNRREEIEGVFGYQTALSLHELSDLNPAKLHMTVRKHFPRNSDTILDRIGYGAIEQSLSIQALRQALDRGLITHQQLRDAALRETARRVYELRFKGYRAIGCGVEQTSDENPASG
jgi:hypothetical protein